MVCANQPAGGMGDGVGHLEKVDVNLCRIWRKLIIQGRGDLDAWVKVFHLEYTVDGLSWIQYDAGKTFAGNWDRNTQVHYDLIPFRATAVKIVVHTWHYGIGMRFGFLFEDQC